MRVLRARRSGPLGLVFPKAGSATVNDIQPDKRLTLAEYRRDMAEFTSVLMDEHYQYRSGMKAELSVAWIYDKFEHLFSPPIISNFRRALQDTPSGSPKARKLRHLLGFATNMYLDAQVASLTETISAAESEATIDIDGRRLSYNQVAFLLDNEPSYDERRRIGYVFDKAIKELDPLRREKVEKLHEAAQDLGYESYVALFQEVCNVDYASLAEQARHILAGTDGLYRTTLDSVVRSDLGISLHSANCWDVGYLQRVAKYDSAFPADAMIGSYIFTVREMGIEEIPHGTIKMDLAARKGKGSRPFCAPVRVPEEVRLVIAPGSGHHDYSAFFHEVGHALHFVWTDFTLPDEFKYHGDRSTSEAFASLFESLLSSSDWLRDALGFEQSKGFIKYLSLSKLFLLRRYCAQLIYELQLHSKTKVHPGEMSAVYAHLMSEATKFRDYGIRHIADVDDAFYCADYLRAWIIEAQLRQYLERECGTRWYMMDQVGEFLISLWARGQWASSAELVACVEGSMDAGPLIEDFQRTFV